jgi:hypothetical protein
MTIMAYTQEHLLALETALARGERRVTFADKTVEYRSVDEIIAAIRAIERQLNHTGPGPRAARQIRVNTEKGF